MVVSGEKRHAHDYIEGLNMLASMRLCSNTPGSSRSRPPSAATRASTTWSPRPGGCAGQRDLAYQLLSDIPGVSMVKPKAALYMFPKLDPKIYPIADDQQFAYELLPSRRC
jgi:Aspartate/tyrosine/aromatic aminotransferase